MAWGEESKNKLSYTDLIPGQDRASKSEQEFMAAMEDNMTKLQEARTRIYELEQQKERKPT